jgi:YD repeat-containing protein
MAVRTSTRGWAPVALGLSGAGAAFVPRDPLVGVRIPKHLGEGVKAGALGISATPVSDEGHALGGSEGTLEGASVVYANTQSDTDTVVKPTTLGFAADTVIRSVKSPQRFFFRVGLPPRARLVEAKDGSGVVQAVDEGVAIATIPRPSAVDAAGTQVPVTIAVSGHTIVLTVAQRSGSFLYPIALDPEFNILETGDLGGEAVWKLSESGAGGFSVQVSNANVIVEHVGAAVKGAWGAAVYKTNGDSQLYELSAEHWWRGGYGFTDGFVEFDHAGEIEGSRDDQTHYGESVALCPSTCSPATGTAGNEVYLGMLFTEGGDEGDDDGRGEFAGTKLYISQPKDTHATVSYNTSSPTINGAVNVLYGKGAWLGPHQGAFEVTAQDLGLGVYEANIAVSECAHGCDFKEATGLGEYTWCSGVQCGPERHEILTWPYLWERASGISHWPEGELELRVAARDAEPKTWSSEFGEGETVLKYYSKPPHEFKLSGVNLKEELGERELHPKVEVTSGEVGGSASPGVRSIELFVDGKQIGTTAGSCPQGPCTASAEWTINGAEFAAGIHTIEARATDNAGNTAYELWKVGTPYQASPIRFGPGSVNPETGAFSLEATDVDLSGGLGTLGVSRGYNSRNRKGGEEGPLGPQWTLSLGSLASLEVLPEGAGVLAEVPEGLTYFAAKVGGGFEPPEGDKSLTLEAKENDKKEVTEYLLRDPAQGTTTRFTLPAGAKSWMPTVSEGPAATNTTTDTYESVEEGGKAIVRPSEELAPHPKAECPSEWKKMQPGCRALQFAYDNDKEKVAGGEAESEWGEYNGRLKEVLAIAYNRSAKTMERIPVARYEYDREGRLRAEWDPRVSPALKTIYGYDEEGHVTALSLPGQQPWLLHYGTIPLDSATGRLLSVSRFGAEAALWKGEALNNTGAPALSSSSAVVGTTLSISNGTWDTEPLAYSYQWERCSESGSECTAILGATNQTYTPILADDGHALAAQVTATNASGSVVKSTPASEPVSNANGSQLVQEPVQPPPSRGTTAVSTIDYQVLVSGTGAPHEMGSKEVAAWGQSDDPWEATAIFPPDEPQGWPASDYTRATIYYRDSHARTVNVAAPSGAISTAEYDETNNVTRSLSPENRATALHEGYGSPEASAAAAKLLDTESTYNKEGTQLEETLGPQHMIKLADGKEVKARNRAHYFYDEGAPAGETFDLVTKVVDVARYIDPEDYYNEKEGEERETTTSYGGEAGLGWKLREPTSVTTDPEGLDLVKTTIYDSNPNSATYGDVVETRSPVGTKEYPPSLDYVFSTAAASGGEVEDPRAIAVTKKTDVWVLDPKRGQVDEYTKAGKYLGEAGAKGSAPGELDEPQGVAVDATEDVWVADTGNDRVEEFNKKGVYQATLGEKPTAPIHFDEPRGIAIANNDIWVADTGNGRIEEFNESGKLEKEFGTKGTAPGDLDEPMGIAIATTGDVWVTDRGNKRLDEFTREGELIKEVGSTGSDPGEFEEPTDVAIDASGDVWVTDRTRLQEFSGNGEYLSELSTRPSKGYEGESRTDGESHTEEESKLEHESESEEAEPQAEVEPQTKRALQVIDPAGVAVDPKGHIWITNTAIKDVEVWIPAGQPEMIGNKGAHDARVVYYTAEGEAEVAACRDHREWVALPCQTGPAAQPEVPKLPNLPVTTTTYNMWDEPEETIEEFGTTKRIKIQRYEESGRKKSSEILESTSEESSSKDAPLPKVSYAYSEKTGALTSQSTTSEGPPLTSHYNTLGQLESYTDAAGNTTTYSYDIDGRVKQVNFGAVDEGKAYQTYTYDPTTGFLTTLFDSTAGTFNASYDAAGQMVTEQYPNGMTASYTYNEVGQATGLEYVKTTGCVEEKKKENCRWFKDSIVPAIHGETLSQTSTLVSKLEYEYDEAGRLTEVQETPTGEPCATRQYTYDEEGERTSLTTLPPKSTGKCGSKEAIVASHAYDTANRLIDPGVEYETLGNVTKLPAADATGAELNDSTELDSGYYVDSQLATQTQDGKTIHYTYDPEGRTLETETAGTTITSHYAGPGEGVTWTSEANGRWTREIPGIDGALDAVQHSGETPVIQLHDLQGNVVATAEDNSEKETKLLSTYRSTEFGVPTTSSPPKYSWLGAGGITTELPSGVIADGGTAYVPQIAMPLQTKGVQPPDNVATQYTSALEPWVAAEIARGSAQQLLQAEQARKAEEEANKPIGTPPTENLMPPCGPAGEYCPGGENPPVEGTGEVGDPIKCKVQAYEPYTEEGEVTGHKFYGTATFTCVKVLPYKSWFESCFFEEGVNKVHCKGVEVQGLASDELSNTMQCRVGLHYTLVAWLWHVHEPAIKVTSRVGYCEENLEEFASGGGLRKILE